MEQFSLEKYLANPNLQVVTRDGGDVKIICTDSGVKGGQVVAIVTMADKDKDVLQFNENGRYYSYSDSDSEYDLFFAPSKHTDYINLYHNEDGYYLGAVFSSEKEAKEIATIDKDYITTIKVELEE